ncbi:MAG: sel1 repeat family protein [Hyphomicrobiales bacterium]|nr:sel1 repeat family protein [Hyphomicrobiales bacterium]
MHAIYRSIASGTILGAALIGVATAGPTLGPLGAGSPYYEAAVRGDAAAQARLGLQYRGNDAQLAFQWLWRAAQQGHGAAQLEIADMFATGRTVPKHLVTAYQWAHLAQGGAEDRETAAKADGLINQLAPQMSEADIKDALRRAADWQPRREVQQPQGRTTPRPRQPSGPALAAADSKPLITVLAPDTSTPGGTTSTASTTTDAAAESPTAPRATSRRSHPHRTSSAGSSRAPGSLRAYLRARIARYLHR